MHRPYPVLVPPLVEEAKRLALDLGFDFRPEGNRAGSASADPSACLDEVGSLLRALVAAFPEGRMAEVGTGAGVGTAWMTSSLDADASLVSVELDERLADASASLFISHRNVEVVAGDWIDVLPTRGSFDLVLFDGGGVDALAVHNWNVIAGLVRPGGIMLLDDLTPEELWPENLRGTPDLKRELAFRSGLFVSTELLLLPGIATLLMVRSGASS